MSDDKHGNETPEHALVKAMLYDALVRRGRKVKKELSVPSMLEFGREWVIDVADVTDPAHHVYYEVQRGPNQSFRDKQLAFARATGKDLVPVYIDDIPSDLLENVMQVRQWVEERVM